MSQTIVIDAKKKQRLYLKDLFRYRELFYFLAWRDVVVRYKQAFFGVSWALLRPILNMVIFTFLFGRVANLSSQNVNYSLFVLAGLLPWSLFANATVETCLSLINNASLVSKVFFPRMIIPISQIMVHLLDFFVGTALLLVLGFAFGVLNVLNCLTFPLCLLLVLATCIGAGLWLSAITVQYRDFRFLVPFFIQFGMFISPVGYGTFTISEKWQWLYALNPMVGIIDAFRWCFFGISYPGIVYSITCSAILSLAILISGLTYFCKVEHSFADRI